MLSQLFQQTLAGIFKDVDNIFKSLCPAIIGVGHMIGHQSCAIFRHAVYLAFGLDTGCTLLQSTDIAVIHTDDKVKILKVGHTHGTRQMRDMIATARGMCPHTGVSLLTLMIADESRRIHLNSLVQPLSGEISFKAVY